MNADTGKTYPSFRTAIDAGEDPDDLVEITGTDEQVSKVSDAVKAQAKARRRAANKRARRSRKRNR